MTEQLSEMFSYEEVRTGGREVIFTEVVLLQDTLTSRGTVPAGTYFHEVYLEFPSLLMTFMIDTPHGVFTDFEINARVEQDL